MSVLDRLAGSRPEHPRPRISIEGAAMVPAWVVAVAGGLVTALGVTVLVDEWVVGALVGAAVAAIRHSAVATGLLVLGAFWMLQQEPDPVRCAVLTLVVHVAAVTARLTGPLSLTGAIETRLLIRVGAAFAVIQVIAQALGGLAFAALTGLPPMPWVGVAGMLAVCGAVAAGISWVRRSTD